MRAVVQRVQKTTLSVDGTLISEIPFGLTVFLGITQGDSEKEGEYIAKKVANLRIFEDEAGKTNLSLADVGGDILAVSQFTLCADCRKGNRPSFIGAGDPAHAEAVYLDFVRRLREAGIRTETGVFGADMQVELTNDGPFTLVLE